MPSGRKNHKKKTRLNAVNEARFRAQIVRVGMAVAVIKKNPQGVNPEGNLFCAENIVLGAKLKKAKKDDEKVPQHSN